MAERDTLTALYRFGLGAAPGELASVGPDPRGHVIRQLRAPPAPEEGLPITERGLAMVGANLAAQAFDRAVREGKATAAERPEAVSPVRALGDSMEAFLTEAPASPAPMMERLALYWSDHFTTAGARAGYVSEGMDREAIRPRMLGPFRDLLIAAALHPAMLFYLDNQNSIGPDSPIGRNPRRRRGLNENLGREILELHALGPDGGYTQDDVVALARIITGWRMDLRPEVPDGRRFAFSADAHEPGPKTLLGKTYAQDGPDQAVAALTDLARHPSAARHVTRRMVRHFVGHGLPGLEARMAETYRRTDGDLGAVTRALIRDDEAWGPPRKVRPPIELVLSASRLLGGLPRRPPAGRALRAMGQPFRSAPSPKGWPDGNEDWGAPDAIKTRLDWASELAAQLPPGTDARALLDTAFGPAASDETRRAVAGGADGRQALTLLLLSPEFQRR